MGASVISALHELRESEDGQTLVLAAIFGLVLMLCVLGTVNLGRAVYDKVQLQAAADEAAYSQAAVEARVMNYTAYTNRAMVVHYASIMAATSYLSWVHFMYGGFKPLLDILKAVPFVQAVATAVDQVLSGLVTFLDSAVAVLVPLLSAANMMLWAVQEGAWASVYGKLLLAPTGWPEAHGGDTPAHAYQPIWPDIIPAMNATVFSQTRGQLAMPQDQAQSAKLLMGSNDADVQMARMHMIEIANSARQPWVAYGDGSPNPAASPLARHWRWKLSFGIGDLGIGDVARTELGSFAPGSSTAGTIANALPQIWSGQKFQGTANLVRLHGKLDLLTFVAMDQMFATVSPQKNAYFSVWKPGTVVKTVVDGILPGFVDALQLATSAALPTPDTRAFFMSPYVSFAPKARSTPGVGPAGDLGNFAQPDVLVGLAKEGIDYNREVGADVYGRKFTWTGKNAAGSGSVDFNYGSADWPKIFGGNGLQIFHKGLNAFAAAQVYYHRPGEWREQPNLFNPLWGARLIPVAESNVYAKLGLANVPLLKQYLSH
jgi:hypothetical protein